MIRRCHGTTAYMAVLGTATLALACSSPEETAELGTAQQKLVGDFLPGVQAPPGLLQEAAEAFATVEDIHEGVGPIFNELGCGSCHANGAVGGAGENIERRFGSFVNGSFNSLSNLGGSLRQLFTVGNFNNPDLPAASRGRCQAGNPTLCCVPREVDPPQATVRNVGRRTQPLFGLGLVDVMPDAFFDQLAAAQPAAVRGSVRRVSVVVPNPGDPSQSLGSTRVARFGWKANVPSLLQFSADAYVNEMAITTQSCFNGQSLNAFAIEPAPNGVPVADGCDDLAERQTGPNPGGLTATQWAQVDDPVGSCSGGRTEIQDDVFLFAVFMAALAPPPRDFSDRISIDRGQPLFSQIGCATCHVATSFVTPANPPPLDLDGTGSETLRVPGNFAFNPYSDFLLHDMGTLGDGIGVNDGDNALATRQIRTQPLWGNRFQNKLLHDGRCGDVRCAILGHAGQAQAARNAFTALSGADQHAVVQFVRSL